MNMHHLQTAHADPARAQRLIFLSSLTIFIVGIALLTLATVHASVAIGEDELISEGPTERVPVDENHMCGCGPSCACGDACGCADASTVGPPIAPGLDGYPASNVTLLGRIGITEFGSFTSGNDCWGYTSPSGREYAIMGLNSAAAFVEITDPVNPQIIEIIPHPSSLWGDMKVYQHYAYVVNESGGGVQVIDMSQIDDGVVTLVRSVTSNGISTVHNVAVNEDSGYLYLCGANVGNGGLVALSLADPANPVVAGAYTDTYVHDAQIVNYTEGPYAGREIAFCFVGSLGIDIVDVTDKSNMFRMSRTTYENIGYSHQGWINMENQILYVDDELERLLNLVPVTTTRVFDVSDLENPQAAGTFTTGLPAIAHNLYLRDGFIYQANYRSGLHIFDARDDPLDPEHVGWLDTFPSSNSANFNGAWSVYPFFPSGNVIISDLESGLLIVDPRPAVFTGASPDLSGDGAVGSADLAILLGNWGPCPNPPAACPADLTGDGQVGAADLAILLGEWG
ncbi:MAG: choice-of-anchor B family protein [Phycisphaeraceae bacterium]|nr:MAG: choice-of-anchor B family protein [Phycisphaeraceae bacterium]